MSNEIKDFKDIPQNIVTNDCYTTQEMVKMAVMFKLIFIAKKGVFFPNSKLPAEQYIQL